MKTNITFTKTELQHMGKAVAMAGSFAYEEGDKQILAVLTSAGKKIVAALAEMER